MSDSIVTRWNPACPIGNRSDVIVWPLMAITFRAPVLAAVEVSNAAKSPFT